MSNTAVAPANVDSAPDPSAVTLRNAAPQPAAAYALSVFGPRALILAAVTCVAACGCSGSATSSEAPGTVTVGQAVTPAPARTQNPAQDVWLDIDQQGEAPSPDFPSALEGWRLVDSWSVMPRAFIGMWSDLPGPNFKTFPATMNGCDSQLFLVR